MILFLWMNWLIVVIIISQSWSGCHIIVLNCVLIALKRKWASDLFRTGRSMFSTSRSKLLVPKLIRAELSLIFENLCRTSFSRSRTPNDITPKCYLHLAISLGDIDCVPSDRPFDGLGGHDGWCNILLSGHGLLWWVSRRMFVIEPVTIQNQPSPVPKWP